MPLPRVPAGCAHLDLAEVSRVLAKHYGDIPASARELNIPTPDLRRLTWARPKLLEEAELERMGVIARAWGQLIEALDSDDPRRQMWASGRIMSSWLARDHPFAPAGRGFRGVEAPRPQVAFRWADGADDDPATDKLQRDEQTIVVPRYGAREGEFVKPPALPAPAAPVLLVESPDAPAPSPPLVQHLYAPSPPQPRREPEPPPQPGPWRRPSRRIQAMMPRSSSASSRSLAHIPQKRIDTSDPVAATQPNKLAANETIACTGAHSGRPTVGKS